MEMNLNSGTASMKPHVSLLFLLISTSAIAGIGESFNSLEKKTQECMSLPSKHISHINDRWLTSLDSQSQKIALLLIKDKLMSRCIEIEERDFVYQLYIKHSQENDTEPMKNWLHLKENHLISQFNSIVDDNFLENVVRLSNNGTFNASFDIEDALSTISN